jgi:mono/diheme cytochrome c family protein
MTKSLGVFFLFLLAGCSATAPPEVTPEMARASSHGSATVDQLRHGRVLFASHCIECHTLPPIARYTGSQWPHLVDAMAGRASLKPEEREAVLSYILATRAQSH